MSRRTVLTALCVCTPLHVRLGGGFCAGLQVRPASFAMATRSLSMKSIEQPAIATVPLIERVKDKSLVHSQAFINGLFTDGSAAGSLTVTDPGSGFILGTVPDMAEKDTLEAIAAAKEAFLLWRAVPAKDRGLRLRRWYDLIVANAEDLATIMTSECGKPLAEVC